jgi:type I restriction enzyme M protein
MARQASARAAQPALEATLWAAADKLRGNMDAAEYKHVALGLIFLKYVSDRFTARQAAVQREAVEEAADFPDSTRDAYIKNALEDRDQFTGHDVYYVPEEARWDWLRARATQVQPPIGVLIDQAFDLIERDNPKLKGVLTRNYARPELDQVKLGEIITLFSNLDLVGDEREDMLGRVYEYFLGQFAMAEGKRGGQFYTAGSVVRLLVEMIQPFHGRVLDPCCGSGGMFVQSERFVEAHGGYPTDISIYGQESNPTTWRLARMNLAVRGITADLGDKWADSFHADLHGSLKADFILANPPFNMSDWGGERLQGDARWRFGVPPSGNANFAWVQHFHYHLAPYGIAGFVLANGSLSSQQSGEGEIRQKLIEADQIDCIVALPGQLFATTQIPVCLWFVARDKSNGLLKERKLRDRRGEVLFIDARRLGRMATRTVKVLDDVDVARVADTYHAWRERGGSYADTPGFARAASLAEIAAQGHVLTPGRYVGATEAEDNDEPFDSRVRRLTEELAAQMTEGADLDARIRQHLMGVGYGW